MRLFNLNPKHIGWKSTTSLVLSVVGMFALSPDEVPQVAAAIGLILGLLALILSIRSYHEHREGAPAARNWAIGAIIFSGLIAFVALDEFIPDKYF